MYADSSQELDLTKFYKGFARYRKLGIMLFLAVLTTTIFGNSMIFPDTYESKTTVRFKPLAVEDQRLRVNVLREEVLGRSVLSQVIADLNLTAVDQSRKSSIQNLLELAGVQTKKKAVNVDSLVSWLSSGVLIEEARTSGNPDMFVITLIDEDPELVTKIVNRIAENYISNKQGAKKAQYEQHVEFLRQQVADKRVEVNRVQGTLLRFRDMNADILASAENASEALRTTRSDLITAKSHLLETEIALRNAHLQLASVNPTVSGGAEAISEDSLSPEELYYKVKTDLDNLQFKYTSTHPLVKKAKNRLALLERRLGKNPVIKTSSASNPEYTRIQGDVYAYEAALAAAKSQVAAFSAEVVKLEKDLILAPNITAKVATLTETVETLHDEHNAMKQRLVDASVVLNATGDSSVGSNFTVVDKASVPTIPVFGNRMKYYIMGIILALLAGFGSIIGMVIITGKSSDDLDADIQSLKASTTIGQSLAFYTVTTIVLLANVGYILSESVLSSIVIV